MVRKRKGQIKEVTDLDHLIYQVAKQQSLHLPQISKQVTKDTAQPNFKTILQEEQNVKVSKHAAQRLQERNIHINEHEWQVISEKLLEAKQKGITDSLIVMNNAALLVSAKNNTVVTAMNREEATSKIFTNINGTILIDE